jgi:hypothetical protein
MRLDSSVANHGEHCVEAQRLAELACQVGGVEVRVIDLDAPLNTTTHPLPSQVVAVPTYLLDGRVVSLGNPTPDALLHLLEHPREEAAG